MFSHKFDEKTKNRIQDIAAGGAGSFVTTTATKKYWMPHVKSALHEHSQMHKAKSIPSLNKHSKNSLKATGKGGAILLGSVLAGRMAGTKALEAIKRYSDKSNS